MCFMFGLKESGNFKNRNKNSVKSPLTGTYFQPSSYSRVGEIDFTLSKILFKAIEHKPPWDNKVFFPMQMSST